MRLLNTETDEMRMFSDGQTPPYAILSHTWGEDEVNIHDWETLQASKIRRRSGYQKIIKFSELARSKGYEWVWIDTCCIDQKSSAELSEAINSMFRWYKNYSVCHVYLVDIEIHKPDADVKAKLKDTRWFTRGWTLQELIAPRNVEFYNQDWQLLGTKDELCPTISTITGIDDSILLGGHLEQTSVARRMSWASTRQTTRVEDEAYSLLGLFDVNIPLIYGEGQKAFQRLQEAILFQTHDQSLFAWGRFVKESSIFSATKDHQNISDALKTAEWLPKHSRPAQGTPGQTGPSQAPQRRPSSYAHDAVGLAQGSPLVLGQPGLCLWHRGGSENNLVCIALMDWGEGYACRTDELFLIDTDVGDMRSSGWNPARKHVAAPQHFDLQDGDIFLLSQTFINMVTEVDYQVRNDAPWCRRHGKRVLRRNGTSKNPGSVTLKIGKAVDDPALVVIKQMIQGPGLGGVGVAITDCNVSQDSSALAQKHASSSRHSLAPYGNLPKDLHRIQSQYFETRTVHRGRTTWTVVSREVNSSAKRVYLLDVGGTVLVVEEQLVEVDDRNFGVRVRDKESGSDG